MLAHSHSSRFAGPLMRSLHAQTRGASPPKDLLGRIRVGVIAVSAGDALEGRLALAASGINDTAGRTGLASWICPGGSRDLEGDEGLRHLNHFMVGHSPAEAIKGVANETEVVLLVTNRLINPINGNRGTYNLPLVPEHRNTGEGAAPILPRPDVHEILGGRRARRGPTDDSAPDGDAEDASRGLGVPGAVPSRVTRTTVIAFPI